MQANISSRGRRASRQCGPQAPRRAAAAAQAPATAETYKLDLPKPIGIRFARGNDGAAYVIKSDPAVGNTDARVQPGDKVRKISASFGADVWEAKNFGQVMYAIKTRSGNVYLELESRGGDMSCFEAEEIDEVEAQMRREKAGGNYGAGTKEIQARNYIAMRELERKRKEMFDDALVNFRAGKVDEALIAFEEVKGMEPKNYIGDKFERVSRIYIVTLYNIACCYAGLKAVDAGLEALNDCMACGFDDFDKIRKDPNLAALREDERFKPTMDKYDEPLINENAIKALKNLFSFGKK